MKKIIIILILLLVIICCWQQIQIGKLNKSQIIYSAQLDSIKDIIHQTQLDSVANSYVIIREDGFELFDNPHFNIPIINNKIDCVLKRLGYTYRYENNRGKIVKLK